MEEDNNEDESNPPVGTTLTLPTDGSDNVSELQSAGPSAKKRAKTVPEWITKFSLKDAKECIQHPQEPAPKDDDNCSIKKGDLCDAAHQVTVDCDTHTLESLSAEHLRLLGQKCGLKNSSKMNKFAVRHHIAKAMLTHSIVDKSGIIDGGEKQKTIQNSLMRLTNVVLDDDDNCKTFLEINDSKRPKDHETGAGGKHQHFWAQVSDMHNDEANDHDFGVLHLVGEHKDEIETPLFETAELFASDVDWTNCTVAKQRVLNLVKVRLIIKSMMHEP